jgi:hypothetical protein
MQKPSSLALFTFCALALAASSAQAEDSIWSAGVGKILPSDEAVWCGYNVYSNNNLFTVRVNLQKRGTDGALITNDYTDGNTKLKAKMQCLDVFTGNVTAPASAQATANWVDNATINCPANGYGVFIRCQVQASENNPAIVYSGVLGGDPCGNGVSGITIPSGQSAYKGQITGQSSNLNFRSVANNAIFNSSVMTQSKVFGTDLGFMFYANGWLWAGYGDTWAEHDWKFWESPYKRGSILFSTHDLDPSVGGLTFSSWDGHPGFAVEEVVSCHNSPLPCKEATAIATAGFALREGTTQYRILWFDSIRTWIPTFTSNTATLAWSSKTGSGAYNAFKRADNDPAPVAGKIVPQWTDTSHFGAGAIVHDRYSGWIYLFGQQPYRANMPIRLARVPAKFASVMDRTKYEYWNGATWVSNPLFPMAPSEVLGLGSLGPAADIIKPNVNAGPEFSVFWDAYADRYLMLLVANRATPSQQTQLWQSRQVTGPWAQVTSGASALPSTSTPGGVSPPYDFFYGPYSSEHINRGGGRNIYFQLSEWDNLFPNLLSHDPYNVGLWGFDITRTATDKCTP